RPQSGMRKPVQRNEISRKNSIRRNWLRSSLRGWIYGVCSWIMKSSSFLDISAWGGGLGYARRRWGLYRYEATSRAGTCRALPWARRPQAAALVAQLADPDRRWDAIVIGEYERAFCGSQYASMAPLFEHYGVGLWMPEVGGRVDWHAEDHEQTMF